MAYILVVDGEIEKASMTHNFSDEVEEYMERSIDDELEEAGYDPEEVSSEKRSEFAVAAGYNGGYAYATEIDIPEDGELDSEFETENGDSISYNDVIEALRNDEYDEDGELKEEFYEDEESYYDSDEMDYSEDDELDYIEDEEDFKEDFDGEVEY